MNEKLRINYVERSHPQIVASECVSALAKLGIITCENQVKVHDAIAAVTEQAYHARSAARWVAIADGEGAEARPLFGDKPHQEFHDFMCVCGQPWKECTTDGMREDIAKIDDSDEWTLDEAGKQFSMHWEHECGKVSLYRLSKREPGADTGTTPPQGGPFSELLKTPSKDRVWIVEQNGHIHSVHATYESAMKEQGENLRIGAPWQVLPWRAAERGTTPPLAGEPRE